LGRVEISALEVGVRAKKGEGEGGEGGEKPLQIVTMVTQTHENINQRLSFSFCDFNVQFAII